MANVGYVEPPKMQRRRKSNFDDQTALRLAELLDKPNANERWVSDQVPYPDKKKATARAQGYRRIVANTLSLDSANIKTRVWEDNGKAFFALSREG
jgi:hypothetical protein